MRTMPWLVSLAALGALALCGCERRSPLSPLSNSPRAAGAQAARGLNHGVVAGAVHEQGELGPGALYVIDVPENWNGDLVLWLHGYTPPSAPVALPNVGLRDFLLQQGYAVAASSFSENGYVVAEGTRQSHQLLGIFAARVGQPDHTFLLGASLGGIIGLKLAETYGQQFDGALLVSGVLGGSRAEIQYIGDVRVLWDVFFPGTIPGSLFDVPEGTPFDPAWVVGAISTPAGQQKFAQFLAFASARGVRFDLAGNEPVLATINALGFQWTGAMDLYDRTHGHSLYDNAGVAYTAPGVPQALVDWVNANVARHDATPDADAFLERNYEPSGKLSIPVLALHGTRDPAVPVLHADLYTARVAAQGDGDRLVVRKRNKFGHVVFDPADIPTAFLDLVAWVKQGTRPAV